MLRDLTLGLDHWAKRAAGFAVASRCPTTIAPNYTGDLGEERLGRS